MNTEFIEEMGGPEFWQWVVKQAAGDDPRGDFIRDTRELIGRGDEPGDSMLCACGEARKEHDAMIAEYVRVRVKK